MLEINTNLVFDLKQGEILKPQVDAIPFRSSYSTGIGVQVTSERGPGFTLTLTHFNAHDAVENVRDAIRAAAGTIVTLRDHYHDQTIDYMEPIHGQLKFAVTQARVIDTRNLAAWQGYRFGTHYKFEPAIRVVSQWTMYAVKTV